MDKDKKTDKKTSQKIDEKIIKAFLLAHGDLEKAKKLKTKAQEKLIIAMKKLSLEKITHNKNNITLCKKNSYSYSEEINLISENLKKEQEIARIKGKANIEDTTEFLKVTEEKNKE